MRKMSLFMTMMLVAGSSAIAQEAPGDDSDAIETNGAVLKWYALHLN